MHSYYYLCYDTDQNWSLITLDTIQTQITGLKHKDAISNKPQKDIAGLRELCAYLVYSLSNYIYSQYKFVFRNQKTP